MNRRCVALAVLILGLPLLVPFLVSPAPSPVPSGPAVHSSPKVVYGPQLTPPDPEAWDSLPVISRPDPELLVPRTRGTTGTANIVVILARFSDVAPRAAHTVGFFDGKINNGANSMRAYYAEASYTQLTIQGSITATWVNVGRPMAQYGSDSASGTDDANGPVYYFIADAVRAAAAAGFNFANPIFDQDGPDGLPDGVIDHLFVIHAGDSQEDSGDPSDAQNLLWSHRWAVADGSPGVPGDQRLIVGGKEVYGYIMASEESPLGVFAHEFGHDLGLPDLYDIDGSSKGAGAWDIMASGSWNGGALGRGESPAHFSSWSKTKLKWMTPDEVTAPRYATAVPPNSLLPLETSPSALKLPIRGTQEYFLVEYRAALGFDTALPGEGLLIWHVDDAQADNADDTHRLLDLVEADQATRGDSPEDATDVWVNNAAGFTPDSTPNSNGYGNIPSGWKIRSIGGAGPEILFDVSRDVDDEVAVASLVKPTAVAVDEQATILVTVTSNGNRTQRDLPVDLRVYRDTFGGTPVFQGTQTIPTLVRGQLVTLMWRYTPSFAGNYILIAEVVLATDEIPENNDRVSHFGAYDFLLRNDVEGVQTGWSGSPATGDYRWAVVGPGDPANSSFSPDQAWRFGWFGGGSVNTSAMTWLTSPAIVLPAGPAYLAFQHRYDLTSRPLENVTGIPVPPETDTAVLQMQVGAGAWTTLRTWRGTEADWAKVYVNLSAEGAGPGSTVTLRWGSLAANQTRDGGWWIDDIFVVRQNLTYGMAVNAARSHLVLEPGGQAVYRLKVYNVGDFPDTYKFGGTLPAGWTMAVKLNGSTTADVTRFTLSLGTDREAAVNLVVEAPLNVMRGLVVRLSVQAVSQNDARQTNTVDLTAEVYDPVGLGKYLKYLPLFFILLIVLVIIALVVNKVRRR